MAAAGALGAHCRAPVSCGRPERHARLVCRASSSEAPPRGVQEGTVTFDPEGLLPKSFSGGHFARRAATKVESDSSRGQEGRAQSSSPSALPSPAAPPAEPLAAAAPTDLAQRLARRYLPVDLARPGLLTRHGEPPVFTAEDFWPQARCQELISLRQMVPSSVGAGNLLSSLNAYGATRTSSSLLMDAQVLAAHPKLRELVADLHRCCWRLLGHPESGAGRFPQGWGREGVLPAPGMLCFEGLQVARYQQGQHFLKHEDAFPAHIAANNRFQRVATLLVYLTSSSEGGGGATAFTRLGVSVQPKAGQALLFFPAFSDDLQPDPWTLHAAEDAGCEKWIAQLWVAKGLPQSSAPVHQSGHRSLAPTQAVSQPRRPPAPPRKKGPSGGSSRKSGKAKGQKLRG